jgi:hypothetical protein
VLGWRVIVWLQAKDPHGQEAVIVTAAVVVGTGAMVYWIAQQLGRDWTDEPRRFWAGARSYARRVGAIPGQPTRTPPDASQNDTKPLDTSDSDQTDPPNL